MTDLKVLVPFPGVIHISYPSQAKLARAFMRVQEFYESPLGFRGKHFTHREFEEAYMASRNADEFTYYQDWAGFNVPGNVVDKFAKKFKLDHLENALIKAIQLNRPKRGRYYVIGTVAQNAGDVLDHELSHAFWYLHIPYRRAMQRLADKLPKSYIKKMRRFLLEIGYHENVLEDEIVAYTATSNMPEITRMIETKKAPWPRILDLQLAFDDYLKGKKGD